LLANGSDDPEDTARRVEVGVHPDLEWIEPRGAHEILVDDVRRQVVAQAALRPFESSRRVFVIVDADRMNDESQNALLKTLEEPATFAVFVLTSAAPGRLLPTIPSRCRAVRFAPLPSIEIAATLQAEGVAGDTAVGCARLAGGDVDKARSLAGPRADQRAEAQAAARAVLGDSEDPDWRLAAPWQPLIARAEKAGAAAEAEVKEALDDVLAIQPKRGRSGKTREHDLQARRARRRAHTASLDRSLELIELWFRDLVGVACGAEEQVFNVDQLEALRRDANGRRVDALIDCLALVEETRRRLERNVLEDLALEALFDRLRRTLS
jgi:DNA polymerase-3 subunit delta'